MRGTWRTAYEWAKLLLSLDPEGDPYQIGLLIDQFALRSRQGGHFLELARHPIFKESWKSAPNIEISKALAEYKLGRAKDCRASLSTAIQTFPWVFERLFHELSIVHVPKSIWGTQAMTTVDKLLSELYVRRAKDLWNTPEAISLLVEVAESTSSETRERTGIITRDITLDEARHILLSDIPELISFIPRKFTTMETSSSDPLPPEDNLPSYHLATSDSLSSVFAATQRLAAAAPPDADLPPNEAVELEGLQTFFSRFMSWLGARNAAGSNGEHVFEEIDRAIVESGVTPEVIEERRARMRELQGRLPLGEPDREGRDLPAIVTLQQLIAEREDELQQERPETAAASEEVEEYDDERNQRWLAGRGLMQLRDFVTANGVDEGYWGEEVDAGPVTEYARRILQLQRQATRNFILDYVLQQGTSSQVRSLVDRYVEGASRGSEG